MMSYTELISSSSGNHCPVTDKKYPVYGLELAGLIVSLFFS